MTCKHPKSSRAYFIFKRLEYIKYNKRLSFAFGENSLISTDVPIIRTICSNCGKVLKEVKVIEK